MKNAFPVALAAVLLSACSTLQGTSTDAPGANLAAAGTAVSQLPNTIQRAAETAWASRDYSAAATHYSVLYQREPNNLQFATRFAESARRSGDPKVAAEVLETLAAQGIGGAPLQIELAKANLQLGRAGVALAAAQQAVAKEPSLGETQVVLGLALDAVGEHGAAAAAYREALAKGAPGAARILNNLALSLAQSGKLDASVEALRKANRLDSDVASISHNLALVEEIAGGAATAPVRPQRTAAAALVPDAGSEHRVQARGVTLSDAHRRVPPTGSGVAVYTPASFGITPPAAAEADGSGDASRPNPDQIADAVAAMRGRMDQLALPVAKSSTPVPPTP